MIGCVDTHYFYGGSRTALLLFREWEDAAANSSLVDERCEESAPYIPGQFYLRELPCIVSVIEKCQANLAAIVIDGYCEFGEGRDGLGKMLYRQLQASIPVIGVAKNPFRSAGNATKLYRRNSTRPLYITANGISIGSAAGCIDRMHGNYRMPTLLKQVDQLARGLDLPQCHGGR
ncbi:MAG: endonuclease V [Pirellulales bacterium]